MTTLVTVLALGFFLGVRHATDPDHVVAVSTLVAHHRRFLDAALIGAAWGIGHTLTIAVVGGAIIVFSLVIPPRLGLSMEFAVALMLMVLGVMNVRRFRPSGAYGGNMGEGRLHTHPHHPGPESPARRADDTPLFRLDSGFGRLTLYHTVRPLIVGIVHGLAGSAAVVLMVLATITDRAWAMLYLLLFGLGTVLGMVLLTVVIAAPLTYAADRRASLQRRLGFASGVVSVAFGAFLAYQLGFVDGLFTAQPVWNPR